MMESSDNAGEQASENRMMELSDDAGEQASENRMMELSGDADVGGETSESEKRNMELSDDAGEKASESEKRNMELSDDAAEKASKKMKEVMEDDSEKDSGPGADFRPYPKPLAKYEDVIAKLLRETLMKLHAEMGTKFRVPVIGGSFLDLHRLFVEVTSRGGFDKVIAEQKWREVTASFSFPSTSTNASFLFRNNYLPLLKHYEQIYFFGSQGWNPSNDTPAAASSLRYRETRATRQKRRKDRGGPSVVGIIDEKFENGYIVTVAVGSQKLKGVLYHIPEQMAAQPLAFSRRRRWRSQKKLRKPSRTGYNFFCSEPRAIIHPSGEKNKQTIGALWNSLTETEKAVYQEKALKDKERSTSLGTDQQVLNPSQGHQLPAKQVMEESDTKLKKVDDNTIFIDEDCDSDGPYSPEPSEIERSSTVGEPSA